jgi:hypothetical protein
VTGARKPGAGSSSAFSIDATASSTCGSGVLGTSVGACSGARLALDGSTAGGL